MRRFPRAAALVLPAAILFGMAGTAAKAADACFFSKTDVMGQLVPQAAEVAWLTGDAAEKASKAIPGQLAAATTPITDIVGLVNSSGDVFALAFDQTGCAFVGDNVSLSAFNAALSTVGHDPLPMPPKRPMQA
ncbi:MAG TPA: hypothetical protein VG894_10420 [Bauldia sp.]|nr:hypothetical protein [Bauldia sp.]